MGEVIQVLNSPFEVGIRLVVLLEAVYPSPLDVTRLVFFDHVALFSADFGGPESLHPGPPTRSGEIGVKREIVQLALGLITSIRLAEETNTEQGFGFVAGEDASPFLDTLDSEYLAELRIRAQWTATRFRATADSGIRRGFQSLMGQWSEETKAVDTHFSEGGQA